MNIIYLIGEFIFDYYIVQNFVGSTGNISEIQD